jgi:hypothetical protein
MSWQVLIWNMFIWTFVGAFVFFKDASMWWLLLAAFFTTTQRAAELYKKAEEEDQYELDPDTRKKLMNIVETAERKMGKL